MSRSIFLKDEQITLQTIERDDLDYLKDLWNHPQMRIVGGLSLTPSSMESMEEYYENHTCDNTVISLLVCVDDAPIGNVIIDSIDQQTTNAELRYMIEPEEQGNGYATEACELLLDHAFTQLGLHKVCASVFEFNESSIGLIEKLGFTREGVHRDERFANGEYSDVCYYGLLDEEWHHAEE